ncbi:hypothetical protein T492DRAFT_291945 [Pavlovales sp. CCMP2436]|nr:hypothetical protein T492DRAFT_291945 [Pavlovales sp. CCMP2436]
MGIKMAKIHVIRPILYCSKVLAPETRPLFFFFFFKSNFPPSSPLAESQKRNTDNGALGQRRGTDEKAAAILARSFRCDNSNSSFARSRFGDGRSASLLQQPFSLDTGSASASPPASQDASPSNSPGVAIPPSGMSPVDGVVPRPGVPSSSGGRTSGWESDGSNVSATCDFHM